MRKPFEMQCMSSVRGVGKPSPVVAGGVSPCKGQVRDVSRFSVPDGSNGQSWSASWARREGKVSGSLDRADDIARIMAVRERGGQIDHVQRRVNDRLVDEVIAERRRECKMLDELRGVVDVKVKVEEKRLKTSFPGGKSFLCDRVITRRLIFV